MSLEESDEIPQSGYLQTEPHCSFLYIIIYQTKFYLNVY